MLWHTKKGNPKLELLAVQVFMLAHSTSSIPLEEARKEAILEVIMQFYEEGQQLEREAHWG